MVCARTVRRRSAPLLLVDLHPHILAVFGGACCATLNLKRELFMPMTARKKRSDRSKMAAKKPARKTAKRRQQSGKAKRR